MSENKIKILFFNRDKAGVNYFRTSTPAQMLYKKYSEIFEIEINQSIDFDSADILDYFKKFNIIHFHKDFDLNRERGIKLLKTLQELGIKTIMDIDDYWILSKEHPLYRESLKEDFSKYIIETMKNVDYVTTTTELFASKIEQYNKNVIVLQNSVDPVLMNQFSPSKSKSFTDDRVNIVYAAGSSHQHDVALLNGVVNRLFADPQLTNKFRIILAGWDTRGESKETLLNPDLERVLKESRIINVSPKSKKDVERNRLIIKKINASNGNIDAVPEIPQQIRDTFRGKMLMVRSKAIEPKESVYYNYEKILTDNHYIIKDKEYLKYLQTFQKEPYYNEQDQPFVRRWTKPASVYANVLNDADIVLAPLFDNPFNRMKSNLKQIECITRKLPIICSDIPPYNVDGINGRNCILIENTKRCEVDWYKNLKKLILSPDLRKELGENLYNDFKEKYSLSNVTDKRAAFYQEILK